MARNGWSDTRLGDLIDVKHGWPFKSQYFSEELTGQPIVVNIGNFEYTGGFRFNSTTVKEYRAEYPKEYELLPGEILLVMTCQTSGGEILGIPAKVPDDRRTYLHNQRLGRVVLKQPGKVSQRFLYWLFLWSEFNRELFVTATGTKILHTAPNRIENFRFRLPSFPEQERIAHILDTLDDKIGLNRRTNDTLEAMTRRLFRSWFVDFDPVRIKAAVRRQHAKLSNAELSRRALPNMSPEIAELFPDEFEDSTLGPIPKGWKAGTVGDIGDNPRRGIQPSEIPADTPYIALEHMPRRCIALSEWSHADGVESTKFRFHHGEILFGKLRPYFHKVGVPAIDGVCSTDVLVIVPNALHWTALLLGHVSSDEMIAHTDTSSTGTKMPRTNWGDIARFAIAIPTAAIGAAASQFVESALKRMHANILESKELRRTRDRLLPKLLSGELPA